ncbi:hypothetical protein [Mammaliicoccus sciuri]|uniref:hypothetical protein n=1 Tax=Mammaliicoccus sciuri TaxID=1296 RepID=UPI0036F122B4
MESPKLQLYNKVFEILKGFGYSVVDIKEMRQDLPYPFFVVSDVDERKRIDSFNSFTSSLTIKVHLWSIADNRGEHERLESYINNELCFLYDLDEYQLILNELSSNTLVDDTTNQLLLHTVLIAEYKVF